MSLLDFIIMFIIAAITGSVARSLVGFDRGGCILSAIVGFIGALIGTWLGREYGLPEIWSLTIRGIKYPVIWSILGAVLFTIVLSLLSPHKKKK
ncbi:GlsB/YeaQ/YmgE family stress response membrane protein [Bacteroidota bacterium]